MSATYFNKELFKRLLKNRSVPLTQKELAEKIEIHEKTFSSYLEEKLTDIEKERVAKELNTTVESLWVPVDDGSKYRDSLKENLNVVPPGSTETIERLKDNVIEVINAKNDVIRSQAEVIKAKDELLKAREETIASLIKERDELKAGKSKDLPLPEKGNQGKEVIKEYPSLHHKKK